MGTLVLNKQGNDANITITVEGRVDTSTAPELEAYVRANIDGVEELIFDLDKLEYISSAGLRVLLSTQKIMNKQGEMIVHNVNDDIMDIFEVTGFVDILNIE